MRGFEVGRAGPSHDYLVWRPFGAWTITSSVCTDSTGSFLSNVESSLTGSISKDSSNSVNSFLSCNGDVEGNVNIVRRDRRRCDDFSSGLSCNRSLGDRCSSSGTNSFKHGTGGSRTSFVSWSNCRVGSGRSFHEGSFCDSSDSSSNSRVRVGNGSSLAKEELRICDPPRRWCLHGGSPKIGILYFAQQVCYASFLRLGPLWKIRHAVDTATTQTDM